MNSMDDVINLGAEEEANRLWEGAVRAQERAGEDLVSMCEALDLGLRAVEILVNHRLQSVKDEFPATIAIQLDVPDPEVDLERDAIQVPNSLPFIAILDLLSADSLECVSPGLHRGWEDRRFSCRRSRITAGKALGIILTEEDRKQLLVLAAYRNRIFFAPPPVQVKTDEILEAFPALNRLVESLG